MEIGETCKTSPNTYLHSLEFPLQNECAQSCIKVVFLHPSTLEDCNFVEDCTEVSS